MLRSDFTGKLQDLDTENRSMSLRKIKEELKNQRNSMFMDQKTMPLRWFFPGRGVWGRMDACMCMAESLHSSPETITTLLISYTPIQNKKILKKIFSS